MKSYTHLAQQERYQIHPLMKAGHEPCEIATLIGRHLSTVGRELSRNRGHRGYRPKQAHNILRNWAIRSPSTPSIRMLIS